MPKVSSRTVHLKAMEYGKLIDEPLTTRFMEKYYAVFKKVDGLGPGARSTCGEQLFCERTAQQAYKKLQVLIENHKRENQVRVTFRRDTHLPHTGDITAVFIDEQGTQDVASRACYAHVGQHSTCSLEWVREKTRPASLKQYSSLLRELESIGYDNLRVVDSLRDTRFDPKFKNTRKQKELPRGKK